MPRSRGLKLNATTFARYFERAWYSYAPLKGIETIYLHHAVRGCSLAWYSYAPLKGIETILDEKRRDLDEPYLVLLCPAQGRVGRVRGDYAGDYGAEVKSVTSEMTDYA